MMIRMMMTTTTATRRRLVGHLLLRPSRRSFDSATAATTTIMRSSVPFFVGRCCSTSIMTTTTTTEDDTVATATAAVGDVSTTSSFSFLSRQQQTQSSDDILDSVVFDNPSHHRHQQYRNAKTKNKKNNTNNHMHNQQQQETNKIEAIVHDLLDVRSHPIGTFTDLDVRTAQGLLSKIIQIMTTSTIPKHKTNNAGKSPQYKHHHPTTTSTVTAATTERWLPLCLDLIERLSIEAGLFYNPRLLLLHDPKQQKTIIVEGIHQLVQALQQTQHSNVLSALDVYRRLLKALPPPPPSNDRSQTYLSTDILNDPKILEPLLKLSIHQNPENPDVLWNAIVKAQSTKSQSQEDEIHNQVDDNNNNRPSPLFVNNITKSMYDAILAVTKSPVSILQQMQTLHGLQPDANTISVLLQRDDTGPESIQILEYLMMTNMETIEETNTTSTSTAQPPRTYPSKKNLVWTQEMVSTVISRLIHVGQVELAIRFYVQQRYHHLHHDEDDEKTKEQKNDHHHHPTSSMRGRNDSDMLFRTLFLACRNTNTTMASSQLAELWNAYRNQPDFNEKEYRALISEFIDLVPDVEQVLKTMFPQHSSSEEEKENTRRICSQFLKQLAEHGHLEEYGQTILSLPMANHLDYFITTLELWNNNNNHRQATKTQSPVEIFKLVDSKDKNGDISPDKSYFQAVWKCLERLATNCLSSKEYSSVVGSEFPLIPFIQDAMLRHDVVMDSEMGQKALSVALLLNACHEAASDGNLDKIMLEDIIRSLDKNDLSIDWESIWQQHVQSPKTALLLLNSMPLPDVKSFNRTLEILAEQYNADDDTTTTTMFELFQKMRDVPPDERTYAILIGRLAATSRNLERAESLLVAMEAQAAAQEKEIIPDARHYHPIIIGHLRLNSDNDKAGRLLVRQIEGYIRYQRPEAAPTTAILDLVLRGIMESKDLRKAHSFLTKMHSLKSANLIPEGPDVNSYRALIRAWDHKSLDNYSDKEKNAAIKVLEEAVSGFSADSFRSVARRKMENAATARRETYNYDNRRVRNELHKSRTFQPPRASSESPPQSYAKSRAHYSEKSELDVNDQIVNQDSIIIDLEHQINVLQEEIAEGTKEMKAAIESRQATILGLERDIAALESIDSLQHNMLHTATEKNPQHNVSTPKIEEKSETTDSTTETFSPSKGTPSQECRLLG